MHICRSALSCCVISGLPHDVIKAYCEPRDGNSSPWDNTNPEGTEQEGEESVEENVGMSNDAIFDYNMNDNELPD